MNKIRTKAQMIVDELDSIKRGDGGDNNKIQELAEDIVSLCPKPIEFVYQLLSIDPGPWGMEVVSKETAMEEAMIGPMIEVYLTPTEDGWSPSNIPFVGIVFKGGRVSHFGLGSDETKHIEDEVTRLGALETQTPEDIGELWMMAPIEVDSVQEETQDRKDGKAIYSPGIEVKK